MPAKISATEATAILLSHGLKPLEPYLNSKSRWKANHISCGTTCYPMLEKVKLGQIGCPNCRYKKVAKSLRHSEGKAIEVMIEAGYLPLEPYVNAHTKWKSKHIACGKTVQPTYNQIQQGQGGCLVCGRVKQGLSGRVSEKKVIDLYDSKRITLIGRYVGSNLPIEAVCEVCKSEITVIYTVGKRGGGCPVCSKLASSEKMKLPIAEIDARCAEKKLKRLSKYSNSKFPLTVLCLQCGDTHDILISSLLTSSGCRKCGMARAGKKRRFSEEKAIIGMQQIGKVSPLEPYTSAHTKWKCKCLTCGAIVYPTKATVFSRNSLGCDLCARKVRAESRRYSQEVLYKKFAEFELIPLEIGKYIQSTSRIDCMHSCGRIVKTSFRALVDKKNKGYNPCTACARDKVAASQRFSRSKIDSLFKERNVKLVSDTYKGMRYRHEVRCLTCKYEWETIPSKIVMGYGCPKCSGLGFKQYEKAYIYLITHNNFNAHKVGIANIAKTRSADRLYQHVKQGWGVVEKWDVPSGKQAKNIEATVLRILRKDLGLPPMLSKGDMPQGGWSETFSADGISSSKVRKMIEVLLGQQ